MHFFAGGMVIWKSPLLDTDYTQNHTLEHTSLDLWAPVRFPSANILTLKLFAGWRAPLICLCADLVPLLLLFALSRRHSLFFLYAALTIFAYSNPS